MDFQIWNCIRIKEKKWNGLFYTTAKLSKQCSQTISTVPWKMPTLSMNFTNPRDIHPAPTIAPKQTMKHTITNRALS